MPLTGNNPADQAYVAETNRLYLWTGTGWYNIALINTSPSITGGYESSYLFETDGTPIEITLVGSDPEGIPLTWSYEVTSGSLTNGGGTTATVSNVDNVFTITPSTIQDYAGSFSLTFKASDGVNIGTAVSSFTLAFKVLNSNYTTLLAKGVAATQNATFVDSSTNAHTITRNGDVYQGTFSPYRAGGYSMYFDGTGDTIAFTSTNLPTGNGAYTVEAWVNFGALGADTKRSIFFFGSAATNQACGFRLNDAGDGLLNWWYANDLDTGTIAGLTANTWNHVAAVYNGETRSIFFNGNRVATDTPGTHLLPASSTAYVGGRGAAEYFYGYINNLRVTNAAVYDPSQTSIIVPIEPLTTITNTSLLINTQYIADSSSNGHAITVNGNTSMQPFSPFNYNVYDEALNGGSAYFDGTGDVLYAAENTAFNVGVGDFTFESWIYPTSFTTGNWNTVFSVGNTTNFGGLLVGKTDTNTFCIRQYGTATIVETATLPPLNSWTHIAGVRSSGTSTLYYNGVAVASATDSTNYTTATPFAHVGNSDHTTYSHYFNGYISNLRLVKGTAIYTSDFTPPTAPLTAITNTSLLLNFTNAGIQDYSQVSNLKLLGNATGSNTQIKNAAYSMYFDGTGDYISLPWTHAPTGTEDFTIEGWFYFGNGMVDTSFGLWGNRVDGTNNFMIYYGYPDAGFYLLLNDTTLAGTSGSLVKNQWTHIAFTRESNIFRSFINGIKVSESSSTSDVTKTYSEGFIGAVDISGTRELEDSYIEDLRVTKGLARYTANFTPPTLELLG